MALTRITRRRTLLAGAALGGSALVAGCSGGSGDKDQERSSAAARLRERAAKDSAALLARYDATLAAHPDLRDRIGPLRGEVARQAEAFGARAPSASPAPSASAAQGGAAPAVPQDAAKARAALAEAERTLADARTAALVQAPPELSRLLASVAASGAAHAYLLTEKDG